MQGTAIRSRLLAVVTLALSAILLTACGGSDGSDQAGSTTTLPNAAVSSPSTSSTTSTSASSSSSSTSSSSASTSSSSTTTGSDTSNATPTQNAQSSAVTLNWQPPTENTDGTTLTDLSGYQISYGTQANDYTTTITLNNPGLTTYVVDNLAPGTYYFTIAALASDGTTSAPSAPVAATVD